MCRLAPFGCVVILFIYDLICDNLLAPIAHPVSVLCEPACVCVCVCVHWPVRIVARVTCCVHDYCCRCVCSDLLPFRQNEIMLFCTYFYYVITDTRPHSTRLAHTQSRSEHGIQNVFMCNSNEVQFIANKIANET